MRQIKQRVATLLELPGDLLLDVARITLVGNMELLIENHRGIVDYAQDRVTLRVPQGSIAIAGENLEIGSISPDGVTVLGKILQINYLD